jgi:FkbM family methyltransferase
MDNISRKIKKYILKVGSTQYIINNYDYFSTEYNIPSDTLINLPEEYRITLDLVSSLSKDRSIIDVGGNCGLFAIPIEKSGYIVYTFEPIKMNVDLLESNKKENDCPNLHIIPNALSNVNENRIIYIPYCSDNTSFNQRVAVSNMTKKDYVEEEVKCITFDSWIENNENINVGFIKIDVQGFEKEVLQGMQTFLKNCNDVHLFIEWDEKHTEKSGSSLDELENLITSNGFKFTKQIYGDRLFYKN